MNYLISYKDPHQHCIDIEFTADKISSDETIIQLPSWRPGRYELGNFAKNIQKWAISDQSGKALKFEKINKDRWIIQTKGVSKIHIKYNYYAAELNAGSTFLDVSQLYMNPVNCCVYIPERIDKECIMELKVPADYKVAIGVAEKGKNTFVFKNFHELADNPFIASATLQHNKFVCEGKEFNLWFQGECKPDWAKLNNDFIKFCDHQMVMMKKAPFESYHFLFQVLPNRMYHGVEHTTSTVCALGPGYNLMKGELYEDLLGVSCHELFHAWNIKTIRPIEMQPYDYTKENYSRSGYVCEGVTTYYGDFLLFRCGVFDAEQYLGTFAERLQKHFDNFGRFNMSVADSSFDTWLDGYVPGIPNRKTNIYDEGNLLAFVTDIFIRKNSGNKHSLDDVMRYLYEEFALKNKGYSEEDYRGIIEHYANVSFERIFSNYFHGIADYEPLLKDAMAYIGCELVMNPGSKFNEHALGMKVNGVEGVCKVTAVFPGSVADKAGISMNDDILSVNTMQVKPDASGTNFTEWCNYFGDQQLELLVASGNKIRTVSLDPAPRKFYKNVRMQKNASAGDVERNNFELWSLNKF